MFDYAVSAPKSETKPRWMTATISAVVHVLVIGFAVGLPILYASDALPEPPSMMAFVVDAPPPPPPPPPAPKAPEVKKVEAPKPTAREVPVAKPLPAAAPKNTVAAPAEAPAEVKPETGNEGATESKAPAIEAGFEKGLSGGVEGGVPGGIAGGIEKEVAPPPPPAPKKPSGPVRVGGKISAPSLVNRVNPQYPPAAVAVQAEGNVVLEATVDSRGRVESVRAVSGHPMLQSAAVGAVKQWVYEPLLLNGEPVPFVLTVTVTFSIPR